MSPTREGAGADILTPPQGRGLTSTDPLGRKGSCLFTPANSFGPLNSALSGIEMWKESLRLSRSCKSHPRVLLSSGNGSSARIRKAGYHLGNER